MPTDDPLKSVLAEAAAGEADLDVKEWLLALAGGESASSPPPAPPATVKLPARRRPRGQSNKRSAG